MRWVRCGKKIGAVDRERHRRGSGNDACWRHPQRRHSFAVRHNVTEREGPGLFARVPGRFRGERVVFEGKGSFFPSKSKDGSGRQSMESFLS
jgi:hypothetical protein